MPFSQRVAVYLGLETDRSPTSQAYGEPIVIYASSANTIWGATIRFGAPIGNVYKGRIGTNFSPSVTCITYDQLKEVGDFRTGNSVPMHVMTGPSGSGYVTFLPLPDHFIFKLENGTTLEANVVMEKGCLSSLEHNLSSGPRR
jgi:hypothetical protein